MGTTERRERERQELRDRILDAARALFAEQGYDAVTMRKIAEKIEYSPTAIYFHFKDKQTLLQELCDTDFGALASEFQKIAGNADPVDRLRLIGRAYVEFAIAYPNHYRLMFMTPGKASLQPEDSRLARGNPEEDAYAFLRATVVRGDRGRAPAARAHGRRSRLADGLGRNARRRVAPHLQLQRRMDRLVRHPRDRRTRSSKS